MSATLGGLLKDYRLQKNISQLEISFAVGWKEPSRLSRIEQGRVGRPKRELLDKIMDAMKLSEEERNRLLLAGNYIPSKQEIDIVRKNIRTLLKEWKYPAVVYDYTWRIIDVNKQAKEVYGLLSEYKNSNIPNMLEIIFDKNYSQAKRDSAESLAEWHEFLSWTLTQFKYAQKSRSKEKWYINLIQKMMENNLFRQLWSKLSTEEQTGEIAYYARETDILPGDISRKLHFNLFVLPAIKDPRFEIEFHTPANLETFKYFEKK